MSVACITSGDKVVKSVLPRGGNAELYIKNEIFVRCDYETSGRVNNDSLWYEAGEFIILAAPLVFSRNCCRAPSF